MISLKNVTKTFGDRTVIDDISLDIYRGETFVIMGCSGSGKSTLMRVMTGALKPDSGEVIIKDKNIATAKDSELNKIKKAAGMLFQYSALLDSLSVKDNVALPIREHTKLAENIIEIIVKMKLSLVGLRGFENYFPSEISGGMRKRVGLARAIALDPDIVFYDEPTSGLDPVVGGVIDKLIKDLSKKLLITSVVVTHNMQSVFDIADRSAMIHKGKITEINSNQSLKETKNPYVRQFIEGNPEGPMNVFSDVDIQDVIE
ncbi:MAG: ABC transporter ATP-binding protein [Candidatus Omnitrophica bacterium]|nr:ABC transporter ATP-binding protein [Candidatus Omnitrophota bacterium]